MRALLALALSACGAGDLASMDGTPGGSGGSGGSGGASQADYINGSRLRARVVTTSDGAKAFAGWYDTQLHQYCIFYPMSDGQEHCLPNAVGALYFSDMGCSTPIGSGASGCAAGTIAIEPVLQSPTCGGASSYYRAFPVAAVYAGAVYSGTPANCSQVTSPTGTFYTLGAELPPPSFVQGTYSIE